MRWHLLIALVACILSFLGACAVTFAHTAPTGWKYPFKCCSNADCRQVKGVVKETANGYQVPSGEIVAYGDKRIQDSPDGEFHWCSVAGKDTGKTLCLFVPPRSY